MGDVMLTDRNASRGFTMVEVIVALVILSVAVLGLSGSAATLSTRAADAELRARALHAVQDRIAQVQIDPRYGELETLYAGTQTGALGMSGFTLTTTITRVLQTTPTALDYKIVSVTLTGPQLTASVSRRLVVGAP
jgi:prepilin-type N-terminal cleavage/methylation domain-containing protein